MLSSKLPEGSALVCCCWHSLAPTCVPVETSLNRRLPVSYPWSSLRLVGGRWIFCYSWSTLKTTTSAILRNHEIPCRRARKDEGDQQYSHVNRTADALFNNDEDDLTNTFHQHKPSLRGAYCAADYLDSHSGNDFSTTIIRRSLSLRHRSQCLTQIRRALRLLPPLHSQYRCGTLHVPQIQQTLEMDTIEIAGGEIFWVLAKDR